MDTTIFAERFGVLFPRGLGLHTGADRAWAVITSVKAEGDDLYVRFRDYPQFGWRLLSNAERDEALAIAEEEEGWVDEPIRHKDGFVTFA